MRKAGTRDTAAAILGSLGQGYVKAHIARLAAILGSREQGYVKAHIARLAAILGLLEQGYVKAHIAFVQKTLFKIASTLMLNP